MTAASRLAARSLMLTRMRSAVVTLGVVLLVGCAPSPALPDRSAVKVELRGLIEDIPGSTAYRYQLKDDHGYDMGPTKVIWAAEAGAFAGIYFTWEDGPAGFVVHLATSSDLFSWDERMAYSVGASQPTIARTPTGRYVVAWEQEPDPIHLVMLEFPTWEDLLGKRGTPRVMQPQVTMPACGEGTPAITSATDTRVDLTFHYHADCERDRQASGWTDWTEWHSSADPDLDAALDAAGVAGHIGDRDSFTYRGYPFTLIEGETVPGDWGSWRLYLYDPADRTAEPLDIRTHGGSRSFSNPGVEIVTIDGHQSLLLTMYLFIEGAAPGEDGGLLYHRELPGDRLP